MDYKLLNKLLANLHHPDTTVLRFVERRSVHEGIEDGQSEQDEYNSYIRVYEIIGEADLFLMIEWRTDSYGDNDFIYSIQFVKPKEVKKVEYVAL